MAEVVNSWWMYLIATIVCMFVLTTSILFIIKSYKDAKKIGMDPQKLKKTLITSCIFSLLPSVSILIGVIALSGSIGIPLPWLRLSVIGALHYEQTAVKTAYENVTLASLTAEQFVTIAFVMTLGILAGPLYCLFGFKSYDKKILSKAKETQAEGQPQGEQKRSFGPILFSAAFIALICSFLAEEICKLKYVGVMDEENPKTGEAYGKLGSFTPAVVVAVSFSVMALVSFIAKKTKMKWLDDFAIGISMLAGMASAVLIEVLF